MEPKIHQVKGYIQDLYIAEYSDKILLLDGGSRGDLKRIENYITKKMIRKMSDIKLVVVTHLHPDHAGCAPILRKKYGIPISGHPELNYWYMGIWGFVQYLLDMFFAWYVAFKTHKNYQRVWYQHSLKPDFEVKDGDKLPFFKDWEVICTPGHTTHDISIFHTQKNTIYIGDLIVKVGNKYNLPFPVSLPKTMKNSLKKVARLNPSELMLAHGGQLNQNIQQILISTQKQLENYPPNKFKNMKFLTNLNGAIIQYEKKYLERDK